MKKSHLLFAGILLFLLFIFFSYLVDKNFLKQLDFDTTVILQDNISRRVDSPFSLLSDVGKFEAMLIALVAIFMLARKFWAGAVAFVLFGGFHLIELFGKHIVENLPPPQFLLRTKHLIEFPQFHVRSEFSYPSGHAGRAFFLSAILIVLILQSRLSPFWKALLCGVIVAYDLAMVVSRVYLGEHWLSDVIGGSILGLSFGLLSSVLLSRKKESGDVSKRLKGFLRFPKYKLELKKVE